MIANEVNHYEVDDCCDSMIEMHMFSKKNSHRYDDRWMEERRKMSCPAQDEKKIVVSKDNRCTGVQYLHDSNNAPIETATTEQRGCAQSSVAIVPKVERLVGVRLLRVDVRRRQVFGALLELFGGHGRRGGPSLERVCGQAEHHLQLLLQLRVARAGERSCVCVWCSGWGWIRMCLGRTGGILRADADGPGVDGGL